MAGLLVIVVAVTTVASSNRSIISNNHQSTTEEPLIHSEIVNEHNFSYLLNPGHSVCGLEHGSDLFLIVYVHSEPSNLRRRLTIRETWARQSMFSSLRLVFMCGLSQDRRLNDRLKLEHSIYNDIVQEDFIDTYRNLTYKGIMAMRWLSEYCSKVKYVLKSDDDMIVNTFVLMRHLSSLRRNKIVKTKTIMCLVWMGMSVIRDKNSKWFITKEEFRKDVYDKYCSGSAFILTGDLPAKMYNISFYIKFFWVDDYHVSGQMANALNATHYAFNALYQINSNLIEEKFLSRKASDCCPVFGHMPNQLSKIYTIWDYIVSQQLNRYSNLRKQPRGSLIEENDFHSIATNAQNDVNCDGDCFKWDFNIWKPFLNENKEIDNKDYYNRLKFITVDI